MARVATSIDEMKTKTRPGAIGAIGDDDAPGVAGDDAPGVAGDDAPGVAEDDAPGVADAVADFAGFVAGNRVTSNDDDSDGSPDDEAVAAELGPAPA